MRSFPAFAVLDWLARFPFAPQSAPVFAIA